MSDPSLMLLANDFEQRKDSFGTAFNSIDCHRVNKQRCLLCGSFQIYLAWENPRTGHGFASCTGKACGIIEELWMDRDGELHPSF